MDKYIQMILVKFIEKYHRRNFKYGEKEIHQNIQLKPTEIYRKYGNPEGDTLVEKDINEACSFLFEKGFIEFTNYKFSDDISKIILNQDKVEQMEEYLETVYGITSRSFKASKIRQYMDRYGNSGLLTNYYCEQLDYQLNQTLTDLDPIKELNTLKILDFIQHNKKDLYVREVSMLVFGDSKVFEEKNFYNSICTIIRNALDLPKDECSPNDEILQNYHIYPVDQEILIKGNISVEREDDIFSIERFQNGISLSSSDTAVISSIKVNTLKFITIENKTAFYRFHDDTYSVMYLGGYANRHQIDLLKKIYQQNPNIEYYHFGDIDIGGFFIHQHLCRNTGIPFQLFHMGIEDLRNPMNQLCLKPLENEDANRARSLADIEPYKDIIRVMLEENVKLEQEIICLQLFEK